MTILTIIRGLPGSGKSTLAKKLKTINVDHFEADQYFCRSGTYQFDVNKLGAAHMWCQSQVENSLMYNLDVIVSNTFTTSKEMKPYFNLAKKYKAEVQVITCESTFKNIHDVPVETLGKMRTRFVTDLISLFTGLQQNEPDN